MQGPTWEANNNSDSLKCSWFFYVTYRMQNTGPLDTVKRRQEKVHIFTPNIFKINQPTFLAFFLLHLGLSSGLHTSGLPTEFPHSYLFFMWATVSAYLISLYLITLLIFDSENKNIWVIHIEIISSKEWNVFKPCHFRVLHALYSNALTL